MKKLILSTVALLAMSSGAWADDASVCYDPRGDSSTIIAACTRVIARGGDLANAYESRGHAQNDSSAAVKDFNEALKRCSDKLRCAVSYDGRASAYRKLGEFDKAVDDYTQSLKLNPKNAFTLLGRGLSYCDLKRFKEAISDTSAFLNSEACLSNRVGR